MEGADMVFIAAGLGGGTGTGASPIIAQAAKELGILTVAVVTKPFDFEGPRRAQIAEEGLKKLKDVVDTYIVIHNQRLATIAGKKFTFAEAFKLVDDILYKAVKGITDIILVPGLVNVDFADVKTIMEDGGKALIGVGVGQGETKVEDAVKEAINSPLLDGTSIEGARRLLINLEISPDLTYEDVQEAVDQIRNKAHQDAHIIFGANLNMNIENEMRITVVATDFEEESEGKKVKRINERKRNDEIKKVPPKQPKMEEKQEIKREDKGFILDEIDYEELENIPAYIRRRKGGN